MMVSAGDPIKYANIHSSYWEKHLAGSDGFQNDWRSFMSEKLDKLRATLRKSRSAASS